MSRLRRSLAAAFLLLLAAGPGLEGAEPRKPNRLPAARVRSGARAALVLDVLLPQGWRLDPAASLRWRLAETWAGFSFAKRKDLVLKPRLPIRIPFRAAAGATGARLVVDFRCCGGSGAPACRDATADYLVVLHAGETETKTEVPVTIKFDPP